MAYLRRLESEAAEREEELVAAHASLTAVEARASNLQNRLLSTMDQLDILQHTHFTELQHLNEEKKRMQSSMQLMNKQLSEALEERQDMRDAVEVLVEKVERECDVSVLNASVIQLQEEIEPMDEPINNLGWGLPPTKSDPTHPFVSTLVTTLSNQLASEKRAHEETKRRYEQKVALLEAQIARREYEIEALLLNSSPEYLMESGLQTHLGMSDDQKTKALEEGSSRNRRLEAEVQDLARKLEQARMTHDEESNGSTVRGEQVISKHMETIPSVETLHIPGFIPERDLSPKTKLVLEALDKHISSLGSEAQELRQERRILSRVEDLEDAGSDTLSSAFLLEEECLRLRSVAEAAQHDLLELRRSSADREAHLQGIITELRQQLRNDDGMANSGQSGHNTTLSRVDLAPETSLPPIHQWREVNRYPWSTSSYVPGTSATSAPASPQSSLFQHRLQPRIDPPDSIESRLNLALEELEAKEVALQNLQKELQTLEDRLK